MSNQLDLGFAFKVKIASYKYGVSLLTDPKFSNSIHACDEKNDITLKARHIIKPSTVRAKFSQTANGFSRGNFPFLCVWQLAQLSADFG